MLRIDYSLLILSTNSSGVYVCLHELRFSLLRTVESIATPCSVKAYERTVECFKLLNRSQFVTSSPLSWCSILSAIFLSLFLRSQIVTLNVLLLTIVCKGSTFAFKPLLHNPFFEKNVKLIVLLLWLCIFNCLTRCTVLTPLPINFYHIPNGIPLAE